MKATSIPSVLCASFRWPEIIFIKRFYEVTLVLCCFLGATFSVDSFAGEQVTESFKVKEEETQ
ncbi:MAG: hypothetical protein OEV15_04675, partial [Gallionella sp.]|nr:hypothetical protein [Gallionella sp.]